MKKISKKLLLLFLSGIIPMLFAGTNALAIDKTFELFGGELEAKGSLQQSMDLRTHRDSRDIQISSFRTMLRIEADYHIMKNDKLDISLYSLAHYWHDTGDSIDDHQRDAIRFEDHGSHALKNYRRSNEIEEILKEFYLDIRGRFWEVRLGRQIVSWGETAFFQVADVINPLDVSNLKVWPDFDDVKVGLWMVRLFIHPPRMWQNISFEFLFMPPDFQPTRLPTAASGIFLGIPPFGEGVFGDIIHHQMHDKPGNDWNNSEWGLRIRGFSFRTDWTLLYFYGRRDDALINRDAGFQNFLRAALALPPPHGRIYRFPHEHTIGLTFSRAVPSIKSTIRGETVLKHRDYQYGSSDIRSKKLLVGSLAIDRKIYVPWLTPRNRMRYLGASFTFFHYKLLGHKYNKHTGEFIAWEAGTRDSSRNTISLMLDYGFYWDEILPTFNFAYDFNGTTTLAYVLKYAPGDHWRFQVSYQQKNEQGRTAHMQDQMMFSVQYEF